MIIPQFDIISDRCFYNHHGNDWRLQTSWNFKLKHKITNIQGSPLFPFAPVVVPWDSQWRRFALRFLSPTYVLNTRLKFQGVGPNIYTTINQIQVRVICIIF